jgi:hypothetical protein
MDAILKQQEELLKVGEELLKKSSKDLRDAAGPDAWRQAFDMWMVRAISPSHHPPEDTLARASLTTRPCPPSSAHLLALTFRRHTANALYHCPAVCVLMPP